MSGDSAGAFLSRSVVIPNRRGLHARAAAKFAPSGNRARPAGNGPAGRHGPCAAGAASQAPSS